MAVIQRSWERGRVATLKDVARAVGVSESTASVVLNNARSGTRVSEVTRKSLIDAAQRLGYRPNALARSLQTGCSNRLGLYSGTGVLDARNMFFAELLGGMLESSAQFGTNTLIHTSGDSPEMLLDLVSNRAVDGLVVHASSDDPILPILGELRVPAVAVADRIKTIPSICADDKVGGMLQAQHLAGLGHRHVILKPADLPFESTVDRQQGFLERAELMGMRVTQVDSVPVNTQNILTHEDIDLLTRKDERATAIVAWNDSLAEFACRALDAMGFSIPAQVAVVGYDGYQVSYLPRFELTTIRAPWAEVGRVAVATLMSLLQGNPAPDVTVLPVEFVRGGTT